LSSCLDVKRGMGLPKRDAKNMCQRYLVRWCLRQSQPVSTLVRTQSPLLSVGPRSRKGQW
jgi:hypothetical protein